MADTNNIAQQGEDLSAEYLLKHGYTIIERNYRNKIGEIDIVAKEGETYCFVEVKTRDGDALGSPLEAVHGAKQYKLSRVAMRYIQENDLFDEHVRFDVVGVDVSVDPVKIELIQDAFEV